MIAGDAFFTAGAALFTAGAAFVTAGAALFATGAAFVTAGAALLTGAFGADLDLIVVLAGVAVAGFCSCCCFRAFCNKNGLTTNISPAKPVSGPSISSMRTLSPNTNSLNPIHRQPFCWTSRICRLFEK